jgi:hypothetical protein
MIPSLTFSLAKVHPHLTQPKRKNQSPSKEISHRCKQYILKRMSTTVNYRTSGSIAKKKRRLKTLVIMILNQKNRSTFELSEVRRKLSEE